MKEYYIYTLEYKDEIFYIGKTNNLKNRLSKHRSESKHKRTHKEKYINKILLNKEDITISILDVVQAGQENYAEIYWISQFRQWGFNLLNHSLGGEGGDNWTGRKHSNETKLKLSKIMKDRILNGIIYKTCPGESNGRSKLTSEQVIEIRRLREDKCVSYQKLSLRFGVSKTMIIDIVKRRKWKHL